MPTNSLLKGVIITESVIIPLCVAWEKPFLLVISHIIKNSTVHLDRHFSLAQVIQSVATITITDGLKLRLFLTVFTYIYINLGPVQL